MFAAADGGTGGLATGDGFAPGDGFAAGGGGPAGRSALRLWYDADQVEALSAEREALWARVGAAPFLTLDEQRAAVGYAPAEGGEGMGPMVGKSDACRSCLDRRYNPNWESQPRVSRGNRDGGQWTAIGSEGGASGAEQTSQLDIKPRSPEYLRCLDHCYAILERYQRPGVDANKWDFHRCVDECLSQKA